MLERFTLRQDPAAQTCAMTHAAANSIFQDAPGQTEASADYSQARPLPDRDDSRRDYFDPEGAWRVMLDEGHFTGRGALKKLEKGICEIDPTRCD